MVQVQLGHDHDLEAVWDIGDVVAAVFLHFFESIDNLLAADVVELADLVERVLLDLLVPLGEFFTGEQAQLVGQVAEEPQVEAELLVFDVGVLDEDGFVRGLQMHRLEELRMRMADLFDFQQIR